MAVERSGPSANLRFWSVGDRHSITRRLQRNFKIVFGGNIIVALFSLVTLALNAHALGTAGLGILALIMTIATLVNRICAFQIWVPLIKLGGQALAVKNIALVGRLTIVAFVLDVLAACAAALVGVVLMLWCGGWLGVPHEYLNISAMYMVTLATNVSDTPTGLLRLFDRFTTLTATQIIGAGLSCFLAIALFLINAALRSYIIGFATVNVVSNLLLLICGYLVGVQSNISFSASGFGKEWRSVARELWSFSWTISVSGLIYTLRERGPILLIGAFLGPMAVGLYHVAERLASVLALFMTSVNQALYPEIVRLFTARRIHDLNWFVVWTGLLCCGLGTVILFGTAAVGFPLLKLVGGQIYSEAYWPLVILIGAHCISMAGVGLRAAIIVVAGPMKLLIINIPAVAVFALVVAFSIVNVANTGLVGIAAAQIPFDFVATIFVVFEYVRSIRHSIQ